jgi:hypothetical protein
MAIGIWLFAAGHLLNRSLRGINRVRQALRQAFACHAV